MRILFLCSLFLLAAVGVLAMSGCSKGEKTYAVTGTVTYKNAPVAEADVSLSPLSEDPQAKPARGKTDSSGRFSLQTYFAPGDDRAGAVPGKYKVTVQKIPMTDGIVDPYKPGGMPKNELPAKYASASETPFEQEVSATAKNEWMLELQD
jgi:hypothetical protein